MTTLEPHPYSDIVYGTWRLLDDLPGAEPEPLASRLELCADLGITTLDTAYGANSWSGAARPIGWIVARFWS
ncbi:MAG: hypothetical protein ABIY55_14165 [Kofleriaceae bacterium]